MNDLVFPSGTQPFGPGSQMCLNFSIIDDLFIEPTERFTVCGRSSQNAVVILNNSCTEIKIRDNDGIANVFMIAALRFAIIILLFYCIVLISPSSLDSIYVVEVQREIQISCAAAIPNIVQWASKYVTSHASHWPLYGRVHCQWYCIKLSSLCRELYGFEFFPKHRLSHSTTWLSLSSAFYTEHQLLCSIS